MWETTTSSSVNMLHGHLQVKSNGMVFDWICNSVVYVIEGYPMEVERRDATQMNPYAMQIIRDLIEVSDMKGFQNHSTKYYFGLNTIRYFKIDTFYHVFGGWWFTVLFKQP